VAWPRRPAAAELAATGAGYAGYALVRLRWLVSPHRIRPSRSTGAALAIGIACAMKITAWPALPVIAVMIAARDGRRAAWHPAVGLCVMFILAPATRWGYFAYPLGLLGWLGLTGRDRSVADKLPAPDRLTWLAPAMARLTSAMAGLLASPGTNGTATALGSDRGDGVPALAALTGPARTARAAGQGPPPRGPASSPSADWARSGTRHTDAAPEPGTEGPGNSLPRIPRVPETRRHRWH
jgi:hypothetical protein